MAYTPRTITTHERSTPSSTRTAARGYGSELEELALGRACVAAPIRDGAGSVSPRCRCRARCPQSTCVREVALSRIVIEAADSISIGLGYVGPPHTGPITAAPTAVPGRA